MTVPCVLRYHSCLPDRLSLFNTKKSGKHYPFHSQQTGERMVVYFFKKPRHVRYDMPPAWTCAQNQKVIYRPSIHRSVQQSRVRLFQSGKGIPRNLRKSGFQTTTTGSQLGTRSACRASRNISARPLLAVMVKEARQPPAPASPAR